MTDSPVGTKARIVADSVNDADDRVTTMEVTYHRFVLAEFNTHRVFSRNSASSRAIPVAKQLAKFRDDPAYPLRWPAEQAGMQGGSELDDGDLDHAQSLFARIHDFTAEAIQDYLSEIEEMFGPDAMKAHTLHKSLLNRWLEPAMWHQVIVTATEWDGFWDQRCSPLAQPEIAAVAHLMKEAYDASEPTPLAEGQWHLPYIRDEDWTWANEFLQVPDFVEGWRPEHVLAKVSAARCARVSYLTQNGVRDPAEDVRMFNRLCDPGDGPPHASPLEHPCTPNPENKQEVTYKLYDGPFVVKEITRTVARVGNFVGWDQLRHRTVTF